MRPNVPFKESFLYAHALGALKAEPGWTVRMYAVYNDLDQETTEKLLVALRESGELSEKQLR